MDAYLLWSATYMYIYVLQWAHFPRIPAKGDGESCSVSGEEKD